MLVKISVPFVLAAAVFAASVPGLDKRAVGVNVGCPVAQGGQVQTDQIPKSGLVVVRDISLGLVGYLAAPKGDSKLFSFTQDRTQALLANVVTLGDGNDLGRYLSIRLGFQGYDSFFGATPTSGGSPGGPISGGTSNNGNTPAVGGSQANGSTNPSNGGDTKGSASNPQTGTTVNTNPVQGGGGKGPAIGGGNGPLVSGGNGPVVGGDKPVVGGDKPIVGGDKPIVGGGKPIVGGDKPIVGGDKPIVGGDKPIVGGGKPVVGGGAPLISTALKSTSTVALGLMSQRSILDEQTQNLLSDFDGKKFRFNLVIDKENKQILGQKLFGDTATQITQWKFDHDTFCLFGHDGEDKFSHGVGSFVNFFLVSQ